MMRPGILIADDNPLITTSINLLLNSCPYDFFITSSADEAAENASSKSFSIAVLDINMKCSSGNYLFDEIRKSGKGLTKFILMGEPDFDSALKALRNGAFDYLKKPIDPGELLKAVQNSNRETRQYAESKPDPQKAGLSESRYKYLVENSPDLIYMVDDQENLAFISKSVERLLGYKYSDLIGRHYSEIIYEKDQPKARKYLQEVREGGSKGTGIELRLRMHKDRCKDRPDACGELVVEINSSCMYEDEIKGKEKNCIGIHGIAKDISKKKQLEKQFLHAQKMDALGKLGAGIAHDFNNLLMGIQGNASLMLMGMSPNHPHHEKLKIIEKQVKSGAALTKQLLGFAKRNDYEIKPTDLNELISQCSSMFGRTKKEIKINMNLQTDIWPVNADAGRLEQVILNLCVNAWQAMENGGLLSIKTENVIRNKEGSGCCEKPFGRYVKTAIKDNGIGMDKRILDRIFEPFFTTKDAGIGTGLGLATVYTIIKNHGGFIRAESEKGKGSSFSIFLPSIEIPAIRSINKENAIMKGTGTILLVDDEDFVVTVGGEMLETLGYETFSARSGRESIEIYKSNKDKIDAVILDMVMPDMNGKDTYKELVKINPDVKVILSSGYSINETAKDIIDQGCARFMQKPFDMKDLSFKIKEVLQH